MITKASKILFQIFPFLLEYQYPSIFINIAIEKPDAHLLLSFGEDFPSPRGNRTHYSGISQAIQLVRFIVPSGFVTLASNTTLQTKVRKFQKRRHLSTFYYNIK